MELSDIVTRTVGNGRWERAALLSGGVALAGGVSLFLFLRARAHPDPGEGEGEGLTGAEAVQLFSLPPRLSLPSRYLKQHLKIGVGAEDPDGTRYVGLVGWAKSWFDTLKPVVVSTPRSCDSQVVAALRRRMEAFSAAKNGFLLVKACRCGKCVVTSAGGIAHTTVCHCSTCRFEKQEHEALFFTAVRRDMTKVDINREPLEPAEGPFEKSYAPLSVAVVGQLLWRTFGEAARRGYCKRCDTLLVMDYEYAEPNTVWLPEPLLIRTGACNSSFHAPEEASATTAERAGIFKTGLVCAALLGAKPSCVWNPERCMDIGLDIEEHGGPQRDGPPGCRADHEVCWGSRLERNLVSEREEDYPPKRAYYGPDTGYLDYGHWLLDSAQAGAASARGSLRRALNRASHEAQFRGASPIGCRSSGASP